MKNRVVHFEIYAQDVDRAMKFYKDVFDWEFVDWSSVTGTVYWGVMTAPKESTEPGINGGLLKRPGPDPVEGQAVIGYACTIQVENIDDTISKIQKAGGVVAMEKFAMVGMAWQAYYKDSEGNVFGIHQADPNAK
jgi:uncharacterized protein